MTRLAEIRHSARMSQWELSHASGVPQSTIAHIEARDSGCNMAYAAVVARLALALGVDVTDLLEDGWDK